MALVKLLVDVPSELAELAGQILIEHGAGGVEEQTAERGSRLIVYGDDAAPLSALVERSRQALAELGLDEEQGNLSLRIEVDPTSDWDTAWTRHLEPQQVTPRWVVQPIWDESAAPEGSERIWIRPTLAFGDGAHQTTRMAAQAIERFCAGLPGAAVLDVGTGTGVLAFVAALSGAGTVVGIDVDAVALTAARDNATLNGLGEAISFLDAAEELPSGFDLVVANLEPRTLLAEAPRIAERARDARELLVTGFLSDQCAELAARFAELGWSERARVDDEGWSLLVLVRDADSGLG